MMTDPVADMIARIRNAGVARHAEVRCPASKLKRSVAEVMRDAGFLADVRVEEGPRPVLVMALRYDRQGRSLIGGMRRVSRPGRRVYVSGSEVSQVRNGLGVAVLSTSRGVLSDTAAREASVGGELVCEVW